MDAYPWSSHHAYAGKSNPLGLVDADQVLRMFSEKKSKARRRYREFMETEETLKKEDVYSTVDQRIQGDDAFVETVAAKVEGAVKRGSRKKEHTLSRISRVVQDPLPGICTEMMIRVTSRK